MSNDETAVSPSIVSAKKRNSSGDTANTTLNGIPSPSSLGEYEIVKHIIYFE